MFFKTFQKYQQMAFTNFFMSCQLRVEVLPEIDVYDFLRNFN